MKKFFTLLAVAVMAFAAQANELTVCEGSYYSSDSPICGLYADTEGTMTQSIYPADMIGAMAGNKITAVKFYTLAKYYEAHGVISDDETDYINFDGAKFQLSLKEVDQLGFEEEVAVVGATAVATVVPEWGDMEVEFVLDEPFQYSGKNLLVEVACIETEGDWGMTYFYGDGVEDYYCAYYFIDGEATLSQYLPMATFSYEEGTTPVDPSEKTAAPTFNGYTTDGIHAYFVEIVPTEPSTIYYRVQYPDETWSDWTEYEDILSFQGDGKYRVEAYAVAEGKAASEQIAYEFVVAPLTGIAEMVEGKTVAGVRYFNMAGQEMQQAEGLTIVVTTYTDGTTSAVKVMK